MLFLFHGSDRQKIIEKSRGLIASLEKKHPESATFRITDETFSESLIDELVLGQGLFKKQYLVLLDGLCANQEYQPIVLKKLEGIASSPNIFVASEGVLDKQTLGALSKSANKTQELNLVAEKDDKKSSPKIFSLANALARRNQQVLWQEFLAAIRRGDSPEEINGVLFWKVKDLFSRGGGVFTPGELAELSFRLVSAYHDAHRGKDNFEHLLERIILRM
jgi:hypothetical protein